MPTLHEDEYRVRQLAEVEEKGPINMRVDCEICDHREIVYVVEHRDRNQILRRHLVCQACHDQYGPERIIVLLEDHDG